MRGLGYPHPERLVKNESWKHVKVAVSWYENDFDVDCLEAQFLSLQKSSLVSRILEKAENEGRKSTFIEPYKVVSDELACYGEGGIKHHIICLCTNPFFPLYQPASFRHLSESASY